MQTAWLSRYGRLSKAVGWGAAARVMSSLVAFVSLPLAVRYLGPERYGVWATVTTSAVWVNLLDMGVSNTLTNHVSQAYAREDRDYAARYVTNALILNCCMAMIAAACFLVLWPLTNWSALLHVSSAVPQAEVRATVAIAAALMLLSLPATLSSKVLAGYQELHRSSYVSCFGCLASLVGLIAGVAIGVSMPMLFLLSAGWLMAPSLALFPWLVFWHKAWLRPRMSLVNAGALRELLGSGSSFFLIQVAALVVFNSDNLVVSHYLGAAEVTPYSVAWRFVGIGAIAQALVFPALWPAYAEAHARGDFAWIRGTFRLTLKAAVLLNVCCAILLLLRGRQLIEFWAGPAAVPSRVLLGVMGVWSVIGGFMNVESCLLAGLNRVRGQAMLSIVAAALNLILSVYLVRHIGSVGVITGTIVSYLVVLVVPQSLMVRDLFREMRAEERATTASARGESSSQDAGPLTFLQVTS